MSSKDLEIRATPADSAALDRARRHSPMSGADYLRFLAQFKPTYEQLKGKKGPRGAPFRLP